MFQDCANCLCTLDRVGCERYTGLVNEHLFCGMACMSECTAFCDKLAMGMDTQEDLSAACIACANGLTSGPDVDAIEAACNQDDSCVGFVNELNACGAP